MSVFHKLNIFSLNTIIYIYDNSVMGMWKKLTKIYMSSMLYKKSLQLLNWLIIYCFLKKKMQEVIFLKNVV